MLFAFVCTDKPDHFQLRADVRPDHLAFLQTLNAEGQLKFAGPFLDDAGKPCGSLVVVEAADRAAADAIAASDPYARAGLFSTVEIRAWNWVINNPVRP